VEADEARDFLLKTGLESDFGPVEPELPIAKSNWLYAVSSDTSHSPSAQSLPQELRCAAGAALRRRPSKNRSPGPSLDRWGCATPSAFAKR
jgi:hypothetical protein